MHTTRSVRVSLWSHLVSLRVLGPVVRTGLLLLALSTVFRADAEAAKYVFLMIGDGMGTAQRTLAELYLNHSTGLGEGPTKPLLMNTFPVQGVMTTHSSDSWVTDSAAAGTALSCGSKTANGVICMDADREEPFVTIAERAKRAGRKVGIVSSVSIDHATPACFYAHVPSRSNYYDIALRLPASGFDYFGGGQARGEAPKYRDSGKSVVEAARAAGFSIARTREELNGLVPGGKAWAFNHTCDDSGALYYELDRPDDHISLAEFTRRGIELLDNPDGFFMMVEGGRIDWACHSNDAAAAVHDVLAFDQAVAEAHRFYGRHPQETLIVVTADHECGGMTIGASMTQYAAFPERLASQTVSHWAFDRMVAEGRAKGWRFEDGLVAAERAFGIRRSGLGGADLEALRSAFEWSMAGRRATLQEPEKLLVYGGREPFTAVCLRLVSREAGVGWTSFFHTGGPVPTSAVGVGADRFGGYYDNTAVFGKLAACMGLE